MDAVSIYTFIFSCGGFVQEQRACSRNEGHLLHVPNYEGCSIITPYSFQNCCINVFIMQILFTYSPFQCVDAFIADFSTKPKYKAAYVYFTDCK